MALIHVLEEMYRYGSDNISDGELKSLIQEVQKILRDRERAREAQKKKDAHEERVRRGEGIRASKEGRSF